MTTDDTPKLTFLTPEELREKQLDRMEKGISRLQPLLDLLTPPISAEETNLIAVLFERLDVLKAGQDAVMTRQDRLIAGQNQLAEQNGEILGLLREVFAQN